MNHQEVRRIIAEGLDLERNTARCIAVKAHLETCTDCTEYLASLLRTISCYRTYDVHVPAKAHELLERALKNLQNK